MIEFYIPFRIRSQIKFCKIKESGIVFRKKASKVMKNIIMNYVSCISTRYVLKFKCDKPTTVPILNVTYSHSKHDLFLFLVLNANKSLSIVNGYKCAVPYSNSLASRIKSKLYFACYLARFEL